MVISSTEIKRLANLAGFDLCGITPASALPLGEERFRGWLAKGYGDTLPYLHRNLEVRFDPSALVPESRSVVVCGVNYKSEYSLKPHGDEGCNIASYALMRDYHKTIRKMLKSLFAELQRLDPSLQGRSFTDSAPLLEKHLAVAAGLGWIGRQSLLVTPSYGTFVLLGELVISSEVDRYDEPFVGDGCGECRACVNSCPAHAITDERCIDARRCISARTVEMDDFSDEPLGGWIFGCDGCQSCCPHNRKTPLYTNHNMRPIVTPPTANGWQQMSVEEFDKLTFSTPLRRSSLERIQRLLGINL